jgi:hypothetical protein
MKDPKVVDEHAHDAYDAAVEGELIKDDTDETRSAFVSTWKDSFNNAVDKLEKAEKKRK